VADAVETVMLPKLRPVPSDETRPLAATWDDPAPSTQVLILPRGRHGSRKFPSLTSDTRQTWLSRAALAAILCVQAALSLRMHNTAFEDEALYLYSGHMELVRWLHGVSQQGNYASYFSGAPVLYPVLGALADAAGGLAAARHVSLLAMLATTALLYSLTRRLFNERVAVCAAALFSATESAIFLGNFATYDAPALCVLAIATWIVVRTAAWRWPAYLLAAPVAALAVATKYAAALFVPTIAVLTALAALPYLSRRALLRPAAFGLVVTGLLYAAVRVAGPVYRQGISFSTTARAQGSTPASTVLHESLLWGGVPFAVAVVGAVAYARRPRNEPGEVIALPGGWIRRAALGAVLAGTALLAPAEQAHLHTLVSLQKHVGFGLFFAAPIAGLGLARIIGDHYRRVLIGIAVWTAALALGMTQASQLYAGWSNSTQLVRAIARNAQPGAHYLVEVDEVPIYYLLGNPDAQPDQFTSTYSISYTDAQGQFLTGNAGYVAAIKAGYFQIVSYNFQTTPAVDRVLATALGSDPQYRLEAVIPLADDVFQYVWVKNPARAARSAGVSDHGSTDGGAGRLVDQDQAAGQPAARVRVAERGLGQPQRHPPDLGAAGLGSRLVPVQGADVQPVAQLGPDRLDGQRRVLHDQMAARR
jgi:4-amino-4-deoxy-L-arabinose transferase-like glycosyltransferase